eukprot:COSAG05_NODE_280_length_12288_cov_4.797933_3_plen_127_part_00
MHNYTAAVPLNASSITVLATALLPNSTVVITANGSPGSGGGGGGEGRGVVIPFPRHQSSIIITVEVTTAAVAAGTGTGTGTGAAMLVRYSVACQRTQPPALLVAGTGFSTAVLRDGETCVMIHWMD